MGIETEQVDAVPEQSLKAHEDTQDVAEQNVQEGALEAPAEPARPNKKRKVAIFLAYVGYGYQGMQRNPGAKTIEDDLFQAMHAAGGISDANADDMGFAKIHWMRAARTDKGVSAVGQCVSLKMVMDESQNRVVEKINDHLPAQIRVFGAHRVTNGFDSRKHCDKRRYEYCLPAWAFNPLAARPKAKSIGSLINDGTFSDDDTDTQEERIPREAYEVHAMLGQTEGHPFVFNSLSEQRLNTILGKYVGTHNHHNFTVKKPHNAADVRRYIMSFSCTGVIDIDGAPWVRMVVIGQSFMLHQIRKMIGMALAAFRGDCTLESIDLALKSRAQLNVPMAPELGLFLDECYFDAYNTQWGHQHGEVRLSAHQEVVDKFKQEQIYPHLASRDAAEKVNLGWLRTLTEANHKFSFWIKADEEAQKLPYERKQRGPGRFGYKGKRARTHNSGDGKADAGQPEEKKSKTGPC